ncbi:hypothetical protein BV898_11204 [Hypsibius exemplaris]|uniref:Uncharacterized protein n=1 Tax=Hypsibius exemplaris TaxID=2072580 RepID=A0A1W0WHA5_HYPEX|nr:hypothetical protein BV898_11204 [Hypsibius exemplaris]
MDRSGLNADQSGCEYETHSGRTLHTRGLKKMRACVQSITKMTHSYTIMVTIDANDKLRSPLFIVMQEITGNSFGPQVQQGLFTDLYGFQMWKSFVRKIWDRVVRDGTECELH